MTFLAPLAWSLLALGLPIVALYLIKTRLRCRPVSTLLFWQQLPAPVYHRSLWRQLRRWVSLALQLLFLALLVFALARPLARWQSKKAGALVLVLDPGASMAATDVAPSRWAQALTAARNRVAAMRLTDEAAILLAGDPPRVLSSWTGSQRALRRALDGAGDPGTGNGSAEGMRDTLTLARHLAKGRPGSRVVVLTDGAWAEPPDPGIVGKVRWEFFGSARPENHALTAFAVRRSVAAPGDFLLAAEARHFGPKPAEGEVEVLRDGRLLDLQPVRMEPGQPWRKTWRGHADGAAKFEARLRFPGPDHLAADDHAEARLAAVAPVRVDLVAAPNGFLDAALGSLPAVAWERRAPDALDAARAPAALTVFYRTNPPTGWTPANGGATLLIDPPGGGFWGGPVGELDLPLVSDFARESTPLRFVGLDSVRLQRAREFRPAPGAEVFAQSFGKPLAFGNWPAAAGAGGGQPRWLVLPFDLENGDFVLRTAFPVLVGNLVQSLRPGDPAEGERLPGEVKSRLARTVMPPAAPVTDARSKRLASAGGWWASAPLWWWAALLGVGWLLAEWWSFSRRITE